MQRPRGNLAQNHNITGIHIPSTMYIMEPKSKVCPATGSMAVNLRNQDADKLKSTYNRVVNGSSGSELVVKQKQNGKWK